MFNGNTRLLGAIMLLGWLQVPWAFAGDTLLTYDRVNLSATASDEVDNDTLVAQLYAQQEGKQAARAAEQVNRDVTWAVDKAKRESGIKVQTEGYRTNPVYRQQLLTGWQVRQSLRLESRDSARLSQLVGQLQERLAVSGISYAVSPERRQEAEAALISVAIERFKERARQIAAELERPGYRLVQMDVNTSGQGVVPPPMRSMAMEMAVAAPTLEAGTQKMKVTVSGTIELQ